MKNNPNKIILHCSVTADEGDVIGASNIKSWHLRRPGFTDIGYHYVIRRTGVVEAGRPETVAGAHAKANRGNYDSLGICLVGTNVFTEMQFDSLYSLYKVIKRRYGISTDDIFGHYEFTREKTCPNLNMDMIRNYLFFKECVDLGISPDRFGGK